MKNLSVIITILIFNFYFLADVNGQSQQLLITDISPKFGAITAEHLSLATVMNPHSGPVTGTMQAKLRTSNGATVATLVSSPFTIRPGQQISSFSIPWRRQMTYGNSSFAQAFSTTGILGVGEFVLCFEFFDSRQISKGLACSERHSDPILNFSLLYPFDKMEIEEKRPILTWEQVALPGLASQNLRYALVLVEQSKVQSAAEALERNLPLVQLENLRNNSLLYPVTAPDLLPGKIYAWMVRGYLNDAQLVSSQQWSFLVASPASPNITAPENTSYVMLQSSLNNRYQVFDKVIRVGFDNNEGVEQLDYMITQITGGREKVTGKLPPIKLDSPGLNMIEIPMRELGLSSEEEYVLEVKTPRGQSYYLQFRAEPKGKSSVYR